MEQAYGLHWLSGFGRKGAVAFAWIHMQFIQSGSFVLFCGLPKGVMAVNDHTMPMMPTQEMTEIGEEKMLQMLKAPPFSHVSSRLLCRLTTRIGT